MKKFRKKKLTLRRDTIKVLSDSSHLKDAAGGNTGWPPSYNSCQCGPLGGSGYYYGCETDNCS